MAYGVHHADAIELRARVWSGEPWRAVAEDLAQTCLAPPEAQVSPPSAATRANRHYRASELLRMSQMMMLRDSAERAAIVIQAGDLYAQAASLTGDRERLTVETPNGPLIGWLFKSRLPAAVGRVLVIGGVEGWAMDFGEMGETLAARGLETLMIDGPGQGESRLRLGHYFTRDWERSYGAVLDALEARQPALPLGVIGNSMGGSLAAHLASRDGRIVACCDNGGTSAPFMARANPTFFQKMTAHVGDVSEDEALEVWKTVKPADIETPVRCPLLVVHGGQDPLVTAEDAGFFFSQAASSDKQMVVFSDGDHCVYNHADDKHALIGDWMVSRLVRP
jgi:alpha-beta hydrolase superfamily lysophospholipase